MLTYDNVIEYQLEITSYCNAACPQCHRNLKGYGINPYMPLTHLSREVIDNTFTPELCIRLKQIFFCGAYGDPIMHPEFLEILQDFRNKNPKLFLYIHTNGGVHNPDYWAKMATIIGDAGCVDFNIDGLEDTLHLYRRKVKYDKVVENAKSYIISGGKANWNFIVFKHNQHQIEEAKQIAKVIGFKDIFFRKTGRFFNNDTLEKMSFYPVYSKENVIDYILEPSTLPEYQNSSIENLTFIKKEYSNINDYFATTTIECDSELHKKAAITMEGLVLPCNFLQHNLYDVRMHTTSIPFSNKLSKIGSESQVKKFLENYDYKELNINHSSLEKIFESKFWSDLYNSFTGNNRLYTCAFVCGKQFKKVWDQEGNKR